MAESNTLAWPSIEQLPREICRKINRFLSVADAAAATIQRKVRGQQQPSPTTFAGGYRQHLLHQLLGAPTSSAEKLDGTNVGVLSGGTLLGRRLVIEDTATSYQRCELSGLRALTPSTDASLEELSLGSSPTRSALYGELCCNAGLYSYAAAGIAKSWLAFGALFEFADEEKAHAYAQAAGASGLVCGMSGATCVRVCHNDAFARIMARHKVPAIAVSHEPHASLCAAVAHSAEWMVSERGEGLVLTVEVGPGRTKLYKWKISREPQPAAVSELEELAAALSEAGSDARCKAALLGPEVRQLIDTLRSVATHVDSTAVSAKKPASAGKQPKQRAIDAAAVQAAISSALTKFDAIDAMFDAQGLGGVNAIAELLTAEVLADPELGAPSEGAAREAAAKEVSGDIKRFVGQAYGAWRKRQGG